ncbi:MAG TPA: hypothetical protein VG013_14330, partial [Gemmataceae bacterium]|nr:hypothetical protein [Gemmataceae bacterium]
MIKNEQQLEQTRQAIVNLEAAVAALKRDVLPLNAERFAMMAEPVVDHIRELQREVEEYVGITSAIHEEAAFWLLLQGQEMAFGDTPSSVLAYFLDNVRRGIETAVISSQHQTRRNYPAADIKKACDLRIVDWKPGSVQVGLRLPILSHSPLEEGSIESRARRGLRTYLQVLAWVGSGQHGGQLEAIVPDAEQRRLLLRRIRKLIPGSRSEVELIELAGREVPGGTIQLRAEARERIDQAISDQFDGQPTKEVARIRREAPASTTAGYTVPSPGKGQEAATIEGSIREIDLDERTF